MMNKKTHALILACFFFACSGNTKNEEIHSEIPLEEAKAPEESAVNDVMRFKYDNVISNIPMPHELIEEIKNASIPFKTGLVNPTSNLSKYSIDHSKAVNLGIYGADLGYLVVYNQFQDVARYIAVTQNLTDALGIPQAFGEGFIEQYDKYQNSKDTLVKIIYDAYNKIDKTLRTDERMGIATLVVTGSWLETLYISTKSLVDNPDNETLKSKVLEQRFHLENILKLLQEFDDEESFQPLITGLQDISIIFRSMSGINNISSEELAKIDDRVSALRNKFVAF